MTPRVTVVMPVYNGAPFIAEAVGSVFTSTYADFELLLLDDGSTDDSIAVARRAAAGDPRLRVVELPHAGIAATRNAGLQHARGELIANLDSDDAMFPPRLARQVAYLDAHPECVAIGTRSVVVNDAGHPIGMVGRWFTHEDIDRELMNGHGGAIGNDTAMIRKSVAIAVGGYEPSLHSTGEDHDMWLRLAEAGRLVCLPDVLNRYRVHDDNVSHGDGSRERRLPITLDTLRRAFARRGITNREPAKVKAPPLPEGEKRRDRALLDYYRGNRRRAAVTALSTLARWPSTPGLRTAIAMILRHPAPHWKGR